MTPRVFLMAGVAIMSFAVAPAGEAQTWRTLDASREVRDSAGLTVRLQYGAGKLEVRPTSGGSLYEMRLKYDADRTEPLVSYDAAARSLSLGIRSRGIHVHGSDGEGGAMHAELSTRVPMDLSLELGAVEGDIQLGGLRLTDLSLKTGAADVAVRFDQPNADRLRTMAIDVGAASLKVVRGGNSGVERVRANVGVGALDLDLGGALSRDVDVVGNLTMGSFTIRVPRAVGVYVDASTFLADFDKTGFVKGGDGWYTPGFEEAKRHVRVHVKAFLGTFKLTRDVR